MSAQTKRTTNLGSVLILVVGVVVGGGAAALGMGWHPAPAPARPAVTEEPLSAATANPHRGMSLGGDRTVPEASDGATLDGRVLETIDASRYTYLRLELGNGTETWAAVSQAPVARGASVRILGAMLMRGFRSSTLDRTFEEIYFGELEVAGGAAPHPVP